MSFSTTTRSLGKTLVGSGPRLVLLGVLQFVAGLFEATTIGLLIPFLGAVGAAQPTVDLSFAAVLGFPDRAPVGTIAGLLIAAIGCRTVAQIAAATYWARSVQHFEHRARTQLIESFAAASWDCQSREPAGKLQQLLTANVEHVAKAFTAAAWSLSHAVNLTVLTAYAFSVSLVNSLAALAVLGGLALVARPLTRGARSAAAQRAGVLTEYAHLVSQGLSLTKEMRIFGIVPWFATGAARLSNAIADARRRQNLFGAIVPVVYQNGSGLLLIAGAAAALAFGADEAASSLIISVLLLIRAVSYGQHLHSTHHQLQECLPYLEQLCDAQAGYDAGRIVFGTESLPRIESVEFDQVGFAYSAERPALCDVSFRVATGDVTAVVGPSGAGKSTLAQLLLGLREPQGGVIRINGSSRGRFAADAWFARVAFVPQDLTLFDESVAECIRFHRDDVSFEQVRRAAEQAGILEEILRLPQGFETRVGDRGGTLSHGQRQRICIARALVGDPDLLIFDEPTSALDPESEARVLQTIGLLRDRKIAFILAHRSATLGVCNKVLVLNEGRMATFRDVNAAAEPDAYYRELTTTSGA